MNIENLTKLADYLDSLPPRYDQFDMGNYLEHKATGQSTLRPAVVTCGTVACAVGHGPSAGIAPLPADTTWDLYSDRVFDIHNEHWVWCFDFEWGFYDNTPKGAAARIRYLIANDGPPKQFREASRDWKDHYKKFLK